jgi:hypothetical protein
VRDSSRAGRRPRGSTPPNRSEAKGGNRRRDSGSALARRVPLGSLRTLQRQANERDTIQSLPTLREDQFRAASNRGLLPCPQALEKSPRVCLTPQALESGSRKEYQGRSRVADNPPTSRNRNVRHIQAPAKSGSQCPAVRKEPPDTTLVGRNFNEVRIAFPTGQSQDGFDLFWIYFHRSSGLNGRSALARLKSSNLC